MNSPCRALPDQPEAALSGHTEFVVCEQTIEAWIHEWFPGLRAIQERSLFREVGRSIPLFHPEVSKFTPPSFYRLAMAMNVAQAIQVARLYRRPYLLALFERHGFSTPGQHLSDRVFSQPDEGHQSDREAVTHWANEFGTPGWFE